MEHESPKVSILLSRYYKREKMTLNCQVITPMFLGNADQQAEWRTAPFKAMLRYWWRVTQGNIDTNELRKREGELFGSVGTGGIDTASKSLVNVVIAGQEVLPSRNNLKKDLKLRHPEVSFGDGTVPALLYLAGMGLMKPNGQVNHSYFPADGKFHISLRFPKDKENVLNSVIALIQAFGAIGARCRNGWGSFQLPDPYLDSLQAAALLQKITVDWKTAVQGIDYPHCLGKDEKGLLLWKTKESRNSWEETMKDLAEAYIVIRISLGVNGDDRPAERHLLGFPITHHEAKKSKGWGKEARHGSPLRFVVRRRTNGFMGFMLHLPFAFSEQMQFPKNIVPVKVWQKVHLELDKTLTRARYEDCL